MFNQIWRRWLQGARKASRPVRGSGARCTRTGRRLLAVERLEDRVVPSAYVVNYVGDSSGSSSGHSTGKLSGDLRYCLDQAIQDQQQDTITFAASVFGSAQTITLDPTLTTDPANANQFGPTAFVASGNANITLIGPAAGVTINGEGAERLFEITSTATLNLQDLTIEGGSATGSTGPTGTSDQAGGTGGAGQGGAVFVNGGTFSAQGCLFTGNTAQGGQGGASVRTADGLFGLDGGNGGVGQGGAIFSAEGALTLINNTFTANTAAAGAGGQGSKGDLSTGSAGSSGQGFGGALYAVASPLTAIFNTFSLNTAAQGGTDICLQGDPVVFGNVTETLTDNILGQSGVSTVSDFFIAPDGRTEFIFSNSSPGSNLISNNSGLPDPFTLQALGGGITTDPMLFPLAQNGGPTETMGLSLDSPALGAGVAADYPGTSTLITTDQIGDPRRSPPSIGAVDLGRVYFVVQSTDEEATGFGNVMGGDGTSVNPFQVPDLLTAIDTATSLGGTNTIQFDPSLTASGPAIIALPEAFFTPVGNTDLRIFGTDNLTIVGPSGNNGISLEGVNDDRLFYVAPTASLTLENLTLEGGVAEGGDGSSVKGSGGAGGGGAGLGGAVYVDGGSFTALGCTFTNNSAIGGDGGSASAGGNAGAGAGGVVGGLGGRSAAGTGQAGGFGGGGGGGRSLSRNGSGAGGVGGAGGFGGGGGGAAPSGGFHKYFFLTGSNSGGFAGGTGGSGARKAGVGGGGGGGAGLGGAIFSNGGTLTLTDSTFTANTAAGGTGGSSKDPHVAAGNGQGYGGAVFVLNGKLAATFNTLSLNTALAGTDIYVLSDKNDSGVNNGVVAATATLTDNILGQSGTNTVSDFHAATHAGGSSSSLSGSNNLISNNDGFPTNGTIAATDPKLDFLSNNGGPTPTMGLAVASPAVGAGVAQPGIISDQRGTARGSSPSIGAFEPVSAYFMVTSTGDDSGSIVGGAGTQANPYLATTLRAAMTNASDDHGVENIQFASNLTSSGPATITTSTADDSTVSPSAFDIKAEITLVGPSGNNGITLLNSGDERLFYINPIASLTLQSLTLEGGDAQGGSGAGGGGGGAGMGGAVYVDGGMFEAEGCTFTNNAATGGDGVKGSGGQGGYGGRSATGAAHGVTGETGSAGRTGEVVHTKSNHGLTAGPGGAGGRGENGGTGGTGGFGGGGGPGGSGGRGGAGGRGGNGLPFESGGAGGPGGSGGTGGSGGAGGFGGGGGGGGRAGVGGPGGHGGPGGVGEKTFFGKSTMAGKDGIDGSNGKAGNNGHGGGAGGFGAGAGSSTQGGGGAGMGGAIFSNGGTLTLTNDTFTANTVAAGTGANPGAAYGGAVFAVNGTLTATFVTFSLNTAPQGGTDIYLASDKNGTGVHGGSTKASAALTNDILGQSGATSVSDFSSTTISSGSGFAFSGSNNLISDNPASGGFNIAGGTITATDPQLSPLANNGGPTQTMALPNGSPAIGAGVTADYPGTSTPITTDQRGLSRPSSPSLGAFDVATAPTTTVVSSSRTNNISTYGDMVTFTATVTNTSGDSGAPSGSVEFFDGATDLGAGSALSGSGSTAVSTFTISTLPAGASPHTINAVYAPTAAFVTSNGSAQQTVNPAPLSVVIVSSPSKTYDGAVAVNTPLSFSVSGLVPGDTSATVAYTSAAYNSAHVISATTVTASGLSITSVTGSNGSRASDYSLVSSSASVAGSISPAPLTASIVNTSVTKVYDGTTAVTTPLSFNVSGLVSGDSSAGLAYTSAYNSAHVISATTVTASGLSITGVTGTNGSQTSDYSLVSSSVSVAASISPAPLTASIVNTSVTKVYDGTTAVTTPVSFNESGLVSGDSSAGLAYTSAYNSAHVISATTVTASGLSITGVTGSNGSQPSDYSLVSSSASVAASISPAFLTASIVNTPVTKVYDGTTAVTAPLSFSVTGLVADDTSVTVADTSAAYNSAHVASATTVTASGLSITGVTGSNGSQPSDYSLVANSVSVAASISPAPLTASIVNTPVTKVYDGTTAVTAPLSFSVTGLVAGDTSVTVADTSAAYNSAHVASATTVTASGLSITGVTGSNGSQVSDYSLVANSVSVAASISPAPLTASIGNTSVTKVYDGTTAVTTPLSFSVTGLVPGDANATVADISAAYDTAHVVSATTVTASGLSITGVTGTNGSQTSDYSLVSSSASVAASISPAFLTASIVNTPVTKVYDGTTAVTVPLSFSVSGLVPGDTSAAVAYTSAAYDSADVVSATTVSANGLSITSVTGTNGSQTSDYSVPSSADGPGQINPASLTVTATSDSKVYDGTTRSSQTPTFQVAGEPQNTLYGTDTLTGLVQAFDSKNVLGPAGSTLRFQAGYVVNDGNGGTDYTVTTNTAPGTITPAYAMFVITGVSATYDGNAHAATGTANGVESPTPANLNSELHLFYSTDGGNTFSSSAPVNAGTYEIYYTFDGDTNYQPVSTRTDSGKTVAISPRTLTVSATAQNKLYDGTTTATVSLSDNRLAGDQLTEAYVSATFADPNVGTAKTVTVSGISISGPDAGNYRVNSTATTPASITPRPITVTARNETKVYGSPDPQLAYTVTAGSLVAGDGFTGSLTRQPGANVGTYGIYQGTLSAGNNYNLTYVGANLTITPAPVGMMLTTSAPIAVPGQPVTFSATVSSPAGTPTGSVTFRDGNTPLGAAALANGKATFTTTALKLGSHSITATFAASGNYAAGQSASVLEQVSQAALETDSLYGGLSLFVGGLAVNDSINVGPAPHSGYQVQIVAIPPGHPTIWQSSFAGPVSRIVMYGGAGNNLLHVDGGITADAWLYAGPGNDTLIGGGGTDVLIGGSGNDVLIGGNGRNILIAGAGNDTLIGGGDDILIGGTCDYAANDAALFAILKEWTRTDASFAARVAHLTGNQSGGLNGLYLLNSSTVHAAGRDLLLGGGSSDLYFASLADRLLPGQPRKGDVMVKI